MKKNYIAPVMEVELLEAADIVTASYAEASLSDSGKATTAALYGDTYTAKEGAKLYSIDGLDTAW